MDRKTDRQTHQTFKPDRKTDRQDRQTDRRTERQTDRQTSQSDPSDLSVCLSGLSVWFVYLVCLSVCLTFHLSVRLSFCLSVIYKDQTDRTRQTEKTRQTERRQTDRPVGLICLISLSVFRVYLSGLSVRLSVCLVFFFCLVHLSVCMSSLFV